jgi:hypothetical protein
MHTIKREGGQCAGRATHADARAIEMMVTSNIEISPAGSSMLVNTVFKNQQLHEQARSCNRFGTNLSGRP